MSADDKESPAAKAPEALLEDVEKFDHAKLKVVDHSKAEGSTPCQARDMTMAGGWIKI